MLRVGVGKADITPPLGTPCSLGLDDECEAVFDPPHVRATVLDWQGERVCLLSADLIGLQRRTQRDVRREVAAATGLAPERILAHATHSHEAPAVHIANNDPLAPYGLQFADPAYYRLFLDKCIEAARTAVAGLFPVDAFWCRGEVEKVGANRRWLDPAGKLHWRGSRPNAELRRFPEGDIEPWVRILLLKERGGPREVLLLNYCCHPTAAGGDEERYATADFPGEAMRLLEQEDGNRFCTYFTGPCGDINPGKWVGDGNEVSDRIRDVRLLGARLAAGCRAALENPRPLAVDGLKLARREIRLPLHPDQPSKEELESALAGAVSRYREAKARGERVPGGGEIRRLVHKLQMLAEAEDGFLPTEVNALGLGSGMSFCFLPGECFLAMARSIWEAAGREVIPVAPTDYTVGYIPTPESYAQGGYEVGVANVAAEAFAVVSAAAIEAVRET